MTYASKVAAIKANPDIAADKKTALINALSESEYSPSTFDIGQFEQLLGKLETSKMRQQSQKSTEGRKDIFATGLAQMMSNF